MLQAARRELPAASARVQELAEKADAAAAAAAAAAGDADADVGIDADELDAIMKTLLPMEQQLLQARLELQRVQQAFAAAAAEAAAVRVEGGKVGLARSVLQYMRSRAWIKDDYTSAASAASSSAAAAAAAAGDEDSIVHPLVIQRRKQAVLRADALLHNLLQKKLRLKETLVRLTRERAAAAADEALAEPSCSLVSPKKLTHKDTIINL
ncbi:uncharacterized protein EMH_0100250 [Eimeria mitis]|uniref:Uncharacterized protein n=1 Tax=Eimeria mitis TaxID=44415 RepID=U6KCG3_9EIME|nr:uncharacterized protein EMH_0100250 [Eimeria mitis]CDJ35720.1 hypothetical protein, conserved [Eimeria mitis]